VIGSFRGEREEDVEDISFYLQAGSKSEGTTPIHPTGKNGDILKGGGKVKDFTVKYVGEGKISHLVI
jgi:hypothetical protein